MKVHFLIVGSLGVVSKAVTEPVPVFYDGLGDAKCFRIPTIIESSSGALLAFAEDRTPGCKDGTDHKLVMRRSEDGGKTWGEVVTVNQPDADPCDGCARAVSNPNPVEVDGKILLHFETKNNPNTTSHGLDVESWSLDDGRTWGPPAVLSYPPLENDGGLIGPSVGLYDGDNIFFSTRFDGNTNLYWSTTKGATWAASKTAIDKVDECSIAFKDHGVVLMNCRAHENRAQVTWKPVYDDDGALTDMVPSDVEYIDELADPGCQGSIVRAVDDDQVYYVSNNDDTDERSHLSVHRTRDAGDNWDSNPILVWPDNSGYSQLTTFRDDASTLGLIFELDSDYDAVPNASHSISFVNVSVDAFYSYSYDVILELDAPPYKKDPRLFTNEDIAVTG